MALGRIESLRQIENHGPESIRYYRNQQTWCYPPHWHMAYEMIMVLENHYGVNVDGTCYQLSPGDLVIISSSTVHEIIAPPTGDRYYFMIDRERLFSVEGLQDRKQGSHSSAGSRTWPRFSYCGRRSPANRAGFSAICRNPETARRSRWACPGGHDPYNRFRPAASPARPAGCSWTASPQCPGFPSAAL